MEGEYLMSGKRKGRLLFDYLPSVNYAMLNNHVQTCVQCVVENMDTEDWRQVCISVTGSLIQPTDVMLDHVPQGQRMQVKDLKIMPVLQELLNTTESVATEFTVTVTVVGEEIFQKAFPIMLLPYDQWPGSNVMPQLLSAFVTPNHPLIARVVSHASQFMEKWTGDASLDAYQTQDRNRVRLQVAAIYEALRSEAVAYCEPPASFASNGQRIRMSDKVLTDKLGTCLDTSLLFASCLEAVGIFPIIIIIRGHAFIGAWLDETFYHQEICDDSSYLLKQMADGINNVVLVETTCLTKSGAVTFDDAVGQATQKAHDEKSFLYFVDVRRCRLGGIRPLPQRVQNGNEWILQNEGVDHENATESIRMPDHYALHLDTPETEITKQTIWERKLLDFSLRNNLINCKTGRRVIPFVSFDIDLLEDNLQEGKDYTVLPYPKKQIDPVEGSIYDSHLQAADLKEMVSEEVIGNHRLVSYLSETELATALKFIYRASRNSLEENGANTLFLAIGMLKWFENDKSVLARYAPVLLMPVDIVRRSGTNYVIRTREEDTIINTTLIELLKQQFKINLGVLDPLPTDDHGVDVKRILATVREGVKNMHRWNVMEETLLGLFSFNKFVMWNDIHNNAEKLKDNEVVKSLMEGRVTLTDLDNVVDARHVDKNSQPSDYCIPIDVDSSQLEAVIESGRGKNFILYGPPGTGKSQTITNMIANALYQNKRVLFVAEKMAALEVVQKRLTKIGLDPFCLELHSNKVTKTHFLTQMQKALDVVHIKDPEEYKETSEKLYEHRQQLITYIENLHRKQSSGFSLYDCISRHLVISEEEMKGALPQVDEINKQKLDQWVEEIERLATVFKITGHPAENALNGMEPKTFREEDVARLRSLLIDYKNDYDQLTTTLLHLPIAVEANDRDILMADAMGKMMEQTPVMTPDLLNIAANRQRYEALMKALEMGKERDSVKAGLLTSCQEDALNADTKTLAAKHTEITGKWFLPKFFAKRSFMKQVRQFCAGAKFDEVPELLKNIAKYQKLRQNVKEQSDQFSALFGADGKSDAERWQIIEPSLKGSSQLLQMLMDYAQRHDKSVMEVRDALMERIGGSWDLFKQNHALSFNSVTTQLKRLLSLEEEMVPLTDFDLPLQNYHTEIATHVDTWMAHLGEIKDWCLWIERKQALEDEGLKSVPDHILQHHADAQSTSRSFQKAVYHLLTMDIVDKDPSLAKFNGLIFEELVDKYKQLTYSFQDLSKKELYCRLAARIPSQTLAAVTNSEMGVLKRNINNGGRGTSIRKIIDQIPTLLPKLCPCMLMSPISVAQYIDMSGEKFDLVIFDEASQMPTSEAIGAIARGKALICVGDPKQMPPTSFFTTQSVDEDEVEIDDMDSILDDCITLSMPGHYLSWHYRSKHESLIAFSNLQYYDSKLHTFPSVDDQQSKVRLVQIEGEYDKGHTRSNPAEARAIVDEVIRRLKDPELSQRSIGIVSFSKVQQNLIEDILIDELAKHPQLEQKAYQCEEPIFIKNLENVQGDERDVILFSVGYGPDKHGKVSMNFGPLNNEGGERRLNVAVSRARYEMIVFATLRAEQIDLKRSSAKGVEGLKGFIEFAGKGRLNLTQSMVAANNLQDTAENDLVRIIAEELRAHGYEVMTHVGRSQFKIDLAVLNPQKKDEYMLGILCDGRNYYDTKTTRDREIVQPGVLAGLGWNVMRVWAVDWYGNHQQVIDRLLKRLDDIQNNVKQEAAASEAAKKIASQAFSLKGMKMEKTEEYKLPWRYEKKDIAEIPLEEVQKAVLYNVKGAVSIPMDDLKRLTVKVMGFSRRTPRIDSVVEQAVAQLQQNDQVTVADNMVTIKE